MKKNLMIILTLSFMSTSLFAQEQNLGISSEVSAPNERGECYKKLANFGAVDFLAGPIVVLPLAIATTSAVVGFFASVPGMYVFYMVRTTKQRHLEKLIDEAYGYSQGGIAGKHLLKVYQRINKDGEIDMSTLADMIVNSDQNGSLCSTKIFSQKRLAKILKKNHSIQIKTLEID